MTPDTPTDGEALVILHLSDRGSLQHATADLRFMHGRLQQKWNIHETEDGQTIGVRGEWRDVADDTLAPRPAEPAQAAQVDWEAVAKRLRLSLQHYMDLAHSGGTEADWNEARDGATAALEGCPK